MNQITNNPFRIIGILANATTREIQSRRAKIKAFARVNKEITSEYDFPFLAPLRRDEHILSKAFSDIEQNQNKVKYALFWFISVNSIDTTAIAHLETGNKEKAIEIWEKITDEREINTKNFSAFNNLGTLYLLGNSLDEVKAGINTKIELIESAYFQNFIHIVADETYSFEPNKQVETFVDELLLSFNKKYSIDEIVFLFDDCDDSVTNYISKQLTAKSIHKIETEIEGTKNKRESNASNAYQYGAKLYENCMFDLTIVGEVLGKDSVDYKLLANDLADEIMQCSIDYFNEVQTQNTAEDFIANAKKLAKIAKSLATNPITKGRIEENVDAISNIEKERTAQDDTEFILEKLLEFRELPDTIGNAETLVLTCKPKLQNIKSVIGATSEAYLNLSGYVLSAAQSMLVRIVNEAQKNFNSNNSTSNSNNNDRGTTSTSNINLWLKDDSQEFLVADINQLKKEYGALLIGKRGESAFVSSKSNPTNRFNVRQSDVEGLSNKDVATMLMEKSFVLSKSDKPYNDKDNVLATILFVSDRELIFFEALKVSELLRTLDADLEKKEHHKNNHKTLNSIARQLIQNNTYPRNITISKPNVNTQPKLEPTITKLEPIKTKAEPTTKKSYEYKERGGCLETVANIFGNIFLFIFDVIHTIGCLIYIIGGIGIILLLLGIIP